LAFCDLGHTKRQHQLGCLFDRVIPEGEPERVLFNNFYYSLNFV
jgi:hypothetical protein